MLEQTVHQELKHWWDRGNIPLPLLIIDEVDIKVSAINKRPIVLNAFCATYGPLSYYCRMVESGKSRQEAQMLAKEYEQSFYKRALIVVPNIGDIA
jgi:hypothetical protein